MVTVDFKLIRRCRAIVALGEGNWKANGTGWRSRVMVNDQSGSYGVLQIIYVDSYILASLLSNASRVGSDGKGYERHIIARDFQPVLNRGCFTSAGSFTNSSQIICA